MMVSLLIERILEKQQCVIVGPCDRVPDAIRVARTEAIDVAVLDVNVAGVKVYPVAEILLERGIPFLLLSGYGQGAVPADHPEWRVCTKPFKFNDLVSMLIEQVTPAD
jgi:CheY-like chemotaxis protein